MRIRHAGWNTGWGRSLIACGTYVAGAAKSGPVDESRGRFMASLRDTPPKGSVEIHTMFGPWYYQEVPAHHPGLEECRGTTDAPDAIPPRMVYVDKTLKGPEKLEVPIHELTHVFFPTASEQAVHNFSVAIADLLWEQGWRKKKSKAKSQEDDNA